jgi:hypothetical protein
MDIYKELKDAGVPLTNHASDLYAKVTPESEAIIDRYEHKQHVTRFRNQIDKELWFDIPFAYAPFWEQGPIV